MIRGVKIGPSAIRAEVLRLEQLLHVLAQRHEPAQPITVSTCACFSTASWLRPGLSCEIPPR